MTNHINENEATATDLRVIKELTENHGWKVGDTLLYQPQYSLTLEQQEQFQDRKSIKPDIVLQDMHGIPLIVIENKLKDPKKAFSQLRLLYSQILKPRFLYACSKKRNLFYDMAWRGLDAGEFRPVNSFLSMEEVKIKIEQEKKRKQDRDIVIDTTIAGGFDPGIGKERYYQADCIKALLAAIKNGQQKMLVHMATGLGKTRVAVALCKALLEHGLARRILFVVDRRLLAEQVRDDGFSLISPTYNAAWITTSNYKTHKNKDIHIVVIDTLEIIHQGIPGNFYDLLIVDECHRSINLNRKIIFDHFLCPRIGLTATPRIAVAKDRTKVPDDDLAILDTYKLFGCESREPTYYYNIDRGIDEGFLAPYKVEEIKTHLTKMAEEEGIEFDYVLDPDERKKIELDTTKKLKLEQLNRKYLTENTAKRIAEEILKRTEYGEKIILFGVSQAHCLMLAKALNKVFNDDGSSNPRYAEPIISENQELNRALKSWFKKPYQKPYIALSVDIMSTGVDIPCVRYIGFSALTKSVGKYIQMLGRGTRLDPRTGKFSFQVFDFVGLCSRMEDNGKGSPKENKKVVKGGGSEGGDGGETGVKGDWFIVDNPDPSNLIQRVCVHEGAVEIIDNIPVEEAKRIFEEQVKGTDNLCIIAIKKKLTETEDYEPSPKDIDNVVDFIKKPQIYMDEGQLQKIYDYPGGTAWDFFLHVLGIKSVPTPLERIKKGYESYIASTVFNDEQVRVLRKIKDIFASNINSYGKIDTSTIFGNPVYEGIIGNFDNINELFENKLGEVVEEMAQAFSLRKAA
ncbi:MAG: DEAD/DEAH box helicase family protein [Deltaproteobacteria bacterium]|nr:DEAD/DEAH box helicase family protein [Deltaproteobacteria bacterium]